MELDNLTSREIFEPNYETYEHPIRPEIKGELILEGRRDSNYSLQSDDATTPHMKCFRTPSVVVSDHSEDTGSVVFDEIRRLHVRRSRRLRRHSDVNLVDRDLTDSSTNSDATEYYKFSSNTSPIPRRKTRTSGNVRKSMSLDESAIHRRKYSQRSEPSSNELSPISSRRSSLLSFGSRRSSEFSEISPVLNRRNFSWSKDAMEEFSALEHQRSVSLDDVYTNSDVSHSDLSSDCSASSSLSNLPGTFYYSIYDPAAKNYNIKPSKSCSDFLSVNRIMEDYPNLCRRRHSNGQVVADRKKENIDPNLVKGKSLDRLEVPENRMVQYFQNGLEPNKSAEICRKVSESLLLNSESREDVLKDVLTRKPSDCSTCSTLSGDHETYHQSLPSVRTKSKTSGWRKLRDIVQWTPFFQTYKKQRYPWVQLAGHQGNFKAGPEPGTILKKLCPKEEKCYKILMKDVLRPYVPEYKGQVTCEENDCVYLQLQDLLVDFTSPCVLDCKLGVRTYLEDELAKAKEKPKLRKDMYEKMILIDPTAPTSEENRLRAVTKPRYMVWRETISSTSTLGFRLEGVRKSDGTSSKDFKTTKSKEQVKEAFRDFVDAFPHALPKYVQRLKAIKATLEVSIFFSSHEVIGSSLLFVHDKTNANVWLIDFAKTLLLPDKVFIDHKSQWEVGNHEDGYLIGLQHLIAIFTELLEERNETN